MHTRVIENNTGGGFQKPVGYVPGHPVVIVYRQQQRQQPGSLWCWNVETNTLLGTVRGVHACNCPYQGPVMSRPYIKDGRYTLAVFSCRCSRTDHRSV